MRSFNAALTIASGIFSSLFANAAPGPLKLGRDLIPRASTCNTPSNRACWSSGFDINTDYETKIPPGKPVSYTLTITEENNWVGPDGVVRPVAMLVNGKFGGPTILADWGDTITINVVNRLKTNGTSIHWHGIRQLNSHLQDGANGVTECPIPPGSSKTYKFLAWQYGTSWYHSHFSAQYANGVTGTIQINGPTSLPYDIDLGTFPITDYYYRTADDLVEFNKFNGPPASDNVLFNGTNKHPVTGAGAYANVTLVPGKRHKLRIINTSAENHFILTLDKHDMTIVAMDFVPVNSFTTKSIFVAIGQRYDVTIDASQATSAYWFNATFVTTGACGLSKNPAPAAIFKYQGSNITTPTSSSPIAAMTVCSDPFDLQPVVKRTLTSNGFTPQANNTLDVKLDLSDPNQLFTWKINASAINVDWNKPIADYVMQGNTSYPRSENIVEVTTKDTWMFWLIENDKTFGIPHPFHLHGHDFLLLGRSDPAATTPQTFNPATDGPNLKLNNPVRRDVAMLPSLGWMVIAFRTDNPGAWLFHCHIAWHVSGGLAVDFLERVSDLRQQYLSQPTESAIHNANCAAWRAYFPALDPFPKQDSGLKMMKEKRTIIEGYLKEPRQTAEELAN